MNETHDKLCKFANSDIPLGYRDMAWKCECVLIGKVRADERAKYDKHYDKGYDQAVRDMR